jgi:hypothetical protein
VSGSCVSEECVHAEFAAVRDPEFPNLPPEDPTSCSSKPTRKSSLPAYIATLTAIALFASSQSTQAANYYINASGPLGNGSGSSAVDAADASSAAKYRAIVNAQSASGTTIVYAAGTYLYTPSMTAYNGVTHQGAGISQTTIKPAPGAITAEYQYTFYGGTGVTGWKIFDLTIDFDSVNQPAWTSGKTKNQAILLETPNNCTIQRIKFINIGCNDAEESFPICFNDSNAGAGTVSNCLIDSCIFTQPVVRGNTGGLTCILLYDLIANGVEVATSTVVSNCQFLDLNRPNNSDLEYAQCVSAPVVTGCYARSMDAFWYAEPGSGHPPDDFWNYETCTISNNTINNCGPVAYIAIHSNGTMTGPIVIKNNIVGLNTDSYYSFGIGDGGPQGTVLLEEGGGTPPLGNFMVTGNTFIAPPSYSVNPAMCWAESTGYTIPNLTVTNNVMHDFPGGGTELAVNTSAVTGSYTHTGNTFASGAYTIPGPPAIVSPPSSPTPTPSPTPAPRPYKGVPAPVPGSVYASNYDLGGQGVGYSDSVGANPGVYRSDGVDLKATSDAPAGTGYVLGWRTTGEWTNYTVNVSQAVSYAVSARVESAFNTAKFHISVDGKTVIPSVTVPLTGPWDTASSWITMNLGSIPLTAGKHVVQVYVDAPWFDWNYLTFAAPAPTPTPTPIGTPSPNDTKVTTVGPAITDSAKNLWQLTSNAQVSLNGTVISYTAHVVEVAYVNGTVWQLNASGNWYSFTPTGALGAGPTINSPLPKSA